MGLGCGRLNRHHQTVLLTEELDRFMNLNAIERNRDAL